MSTSSPAGPQRPANAVHEDETQRLVASIAELAADLRALAPPGAHGARANAALDRLLDLPEAHRPAALALAFAEFEQACAAAAPDPDGVSEDLRAFVREHYAVLLAEPTFAQVIEGPLRRAGMMAWLLRENIGTLERARAEQHRRQAEIERLRREVARIDAEKLVLESDLARSRALADRGLAAAGLAHDFNNLLQAIVGHTSVALSRLEAGDPDREALERVVEAARRAAELSTGLSRWNHDARPRPRRVDLSRLVEDVLDLMAPASPRHADEQRVLPPDLPAVLAEPTDVRRIVLNLVVNAWQALGTRGGTVRVTTGVSASHDEELVFVEVEDDGPGLDDDVRARLFEPLFSTREGGSGIGLPNVKLLAERWGGRVEAWSARGAGARFRVSLPAAPDEDEAAGRA